MRKKIAIVVVLAMVVLLSFPLVAFAANGFDGGTGVLTIDTQWNTAGLAFEDEVNTLTSNNVNSVTTLNITAGELTDTDILWITNSLINLQYFNMSGDAYFTTEADGVTSILPDNVFYDSDELLGITIDIDSKYILEFSYGAIRNCDKLVGVGINNTTTFGNYGFYGNDFLISVTLPKTTSFGYRAFSESDGLVSITMPEATTFGFSAFDDCDALVSVSLPKAITFEENAFRECVSLMNVDMPEVTTFGNNAFKDCISLVNISLPKATTFGTYALADCDDLVGVSLPKAEYFAGDAFTYCPSLSSISLPSVQHLGSYSFGHSDNIIEVKLPSLTSLGSRIFRYGNLNSITLTLGSTIPTIDSESFTEYDPAAKSAILYIPVGSAAAYDADEGLPDDSMWYGWSLVPFVEIPQTGQSNNFSWLYIALSILLIISILGARRIYVKNKNV